MLNVKYFISKLSGGGVEHWFLLTMPTSMQGGGHLGPNHVSVIQSCSLDSIADVIVFQT